MSHPPASHELFVPSLGSLVRPIPSRRFSGARFSNAVAAINKNKIEGEKAEMGVFAMSKTRERERGAFDAEETGQGRLNDRDINIDNSI